MERWRRTQICREKSTITSLSEYSHHESERERDEDPSELWDLPDNNEEESGTSREWREREMKILLSCETLPEQQWRRVSGTSREWREREMKILLSCETLPEQQWRRISGTSREWREREMKILLSCETLPEQQWRRISGTSRERRERDEDPSELWDFTWQQWRRISGTSREWREREMKILLSCETLPEQQWRRISGTSREWREREMKILLSCETLPEQQWRRSQEHHESEERERWRSFWAVRLYLNNNEEDLRNITRVKRERDEDPLSCETLPEQQWRRISEHHEREERERWRSFWAVRLYLNNNEEESQEHHESERERERDEDPSELWDFTWTTMKKNLRNIRVKRERDEDPSELWDFTWTTMKKNLSNITREKRERWRSLWAVRLYLNNNEEESQ